MKQKKAAHGKKSSAPIWILYIVSFLLTVGLAAFCLWLFVFSEDARPTKANEQKPVVDAVWQQLDAVTLAATLDGVYQDTVQGCALTQKGDQYSLSVTLQKDGTPTSMTFSLAEPTVKPAQAQQGNLSARRLTTAVLKDIGEDTLADYAEHLDEYGATVIKSFYDDADGDGKKEYVYVVRGLVDAWAEKADRGDILRPLCNQPICLYIDPEGTSAVVHGLMLSGNVSDVQTASWMNGILRVVYTDAMGSRQELKAFVCDYAATVADYTTDTQALERVGAQYSAYLSDSGYAEVVPQYVDVSDAAGTELVLTYRDGSSYHTVILTVQGGKLSKLYATNDMDGALFLVEQDGTPYLFWYTQVNEQDISRFYKYALFRVNDRGEWIVKDSKELTVSVSEDLRADEAFFNTVKTYAEKGTTCHDRYDLLATLEALTQRPTTEGSTNYLRITNCSTDKTGVVTLQDVNSWLRMRTGPSTAHGEVLLDANDKTSVVKQYHGSNVTIVRPHNTGDADEPIWLEIAVKYPNKTVTGYSSQRFIRTDAVRRLNVGDRFTITTETDQAALSWISSDTSVVTVDSTGTLTAHRAGMVLVTVKSASGLEDSCLIMVGGTAREGA